MSKIDLLNEGKYIATINNTVKDLNKHMVLVSVEHIEDLNKYKIPYLVCHSDLYICTRGKKKKKFNQDQVKVIKKDLDNGLSIRKCATKYQCSTKLIQSIKKDEYLSK